MSHLTHFYPIVHCCHTHHSHSSTVAQPPNQYSPTKRKGLDALVMYSSRQGWQLNLKYSVTYFVDLVWLAWSISSPANRVWRTSDVYCLHQSCHTAMWKTHHISMYISYPIDCISVIIVHLKIMHKTFLLSQHGGHESHSKQAYMSSHKQNMGGLLNHQTSPIPKE